MSADLGMYRPSRDSYFLDIAEVVATRSTCLRRAVGCVLVDIHGNIVATGYNGVPRGQAHCNEGFPCPGATKSSGLGLAECYAIHAEQNALMQCPNVNQLTTAYVTSSPCVHCVKMLLNTSAKVIVYGERYTHEESFLLWEAAGRVIRPWSI